MDHKNPCMDLSGSLSLPMNRLLTSTKMKKNLENTFLLKHEKSFSNISLLKFDVQQPKLLSQNALVSSSIEKETVRSVRNEIVEKKLNISNRILAKSATTATSLSFKTNAELKPTLKRLLSSSVEREHVKKQRAFRNNENKPNLRFEATSGLNTTIFQMDVKDSENVSDNGSMKKHEMFVNTSNVCKVDEMPEYKLHLSDDVELSDHILSKYLMDDNLLSDTSEKRNLEIIHMKKSFLDVVSCSLVAACELKKSNDPIRIRIIQSAASLLKVDPEFILKVALYSREELNIRTASNFILAFAAQSPECRSFLRKYFKHAIRLPSDWTEVALLHQTFHEASVPLGTFSAALRKAMVDKFCDFDVYQLAKYNKTKSTSTKAKVSRTKNVSGCETERDESEESCELTAFTLKMLIRRLHIARPAEYVMSVVGKKYPDDLKSFQKSGLLGVWDDSRAGERMKLPIPETWETQVAMHGNKAEVWQQLLDNRKLPFMAMLRNIRNLIFSGISKHHHQLVINILTNEVSVAKSRQFPFRFFSAFEALNTLEELLNKLQNKVAETDVTEELEESKYAKKKKLRKNRPLNFDLNVLQKYRAALNESIRLATMHNLVHIRGQTLIFCDCNMIYFQPCNTAKGLGKPRTIIEMELLLGLMLQSACEDSQFVLFGTGNYEIILHANSPILTTVEKLVKKVKTLHNSSKKDSQFPMGILNKKLRDYQQVNNIIVFSPGDTFDGLEFFLKTFRMIVNPDLLFVQVDLSGADRRLKDISQLHSSKDIYLSGFSDQLFRFIAEKGSNEQVRYVDNIDKKYKLDGTQRKVNLERTLDTSQTPIYSTPRWRSIRVFISSTFRDFHAERDTLVRYIFPEIRRRARNLFLEIHEIDLRWGITEQETTDNKAVEICLRESVKCDIFVGFLGNRYGSIPELSAIPDSEEFKWVRSHPPGASITELEFYGGALTNPKRRKENAIFCIRDNAFLRDIPLDIQSDFISESDESEKRITALKAAVRSSGYLLYDNYPCNWKGVVNGKPIVDGLHLLCEWLSRALWDSIKNYYPLSEVEDMQVSIEDEFASETACHNEFVEQHCKSFIARNNIVQQCMKHVCDKNVKFIVVFGKSGGGKTSLMAFLYQELRKTKAKVFSHFVGASSNARSITNMLQRFCHEFQSLLKLNSSIPSNYNDLVIYFTFLMESLQTVEGMIVLVIDGLTEMNTDFSLNWLPEILPKNVIVICSTNEDTDLYRTMLRRKDSISVNIRYLSFAERVQIIRSLLEPHRKALSDSFLSNQVSVLASKRDAGLPLYLTLACNQIRLYGTYGDIENMLHYLPPALKEFLHLKLDYLSEQYGCDVVWLVIGALAVVKNGLTEDDLYAMLCLNNIEMSDKPETINEELVTPRSLFAKLILDLMEFLKPLENSGNSNLIFANGKMACEAWNYCKKKWIYLSEEYLHTLLSKLYYKKADPTGNYLWLGDCASAFSSLIYHYIKGGCVNEAKQALTNLQFLYAKARRGMSTELLQDFLDVENLLLEEEEKEEEKIVDWKDYKEFVNRNQHLFTFSPSLIFQQAINNPGKSLLADNAQKLLGSPYMKTVMSWINKPQKEKCMKKIRFNEVITCVQTSTCKKMFALGTESGVIVLLDASTLKEKETLFGHSKSVTSVCFLQSMKLCSASLDCTLCLWDICSGSRSIVLTGHLAGVTGCVSNSDGNTLVSVGLDCTLRTWNVYSGQEISIKKQKRPISSVAFHPHKVVVAIGMWDSTVRLVDLITMKQIALYRGNSSSILAIDFSPCGSFLVAGSLDGNVQMWSTTCGINILKFPTHALAINGVKFLTSESFATVGEDCSVQVWHSYFQEFIEFCHIDFEARLLCMVYDEESSFVVAGFSSGEVKRLNTNTGHEEFSAFHLQSPVTCIMASDKTITVGYYSGRVVILELKNGRVLNDWYCHESTISALACYKNYVVSGSVDGMLALLDISNNVIKHYIAHLSNVTSISFHPRKAYFASVSRDKTVKIWNIFNHKVNMIAVNELCHSDWINCCEWLITPQGENFLITGGDDCLMKLWKVENDFHTILEVLVIGSFPSPIQFAYVKKSRILGGSREFFKMFDHMGNELMASSVSNVRCFATRSQISDTAQSLDESEHTEEMGCAQALPFISWIVLMGSDKLLKMKLNQEPQTHKLECHSKSVLGLSVLENNELVTCASDGFVCVSDATVESNHEHNLSTQICAMQWNSINRILITGTKDGHINLWDWSPKAKSPLIRLSKKIHSNSVNAICFYTSDDENITFATGSNDCHLRLWKVYETDIRRIKSINFKVPIICLDYDADLNFLVGGGWHGAIWLFDMQTLKTVDTYESKYPFSWILNAKFLPSKRIVFFDDCGHMNLAVWEQKRKHIQILKQGSYCDSNYLSHSVTEISSEGDKMLRWLICQAQGMVTDVKITETEPTFQAYQIQKKRILTTTYSSFQNILLTSSDDQMLRVWRKQEDRTFKQIGQFACSAPVTTIHVLNGMEDFGPNVPIVCGDAHGNVYFLQWLQF